MSGNVIGVFTRICPVCANEVIHHVKGNRDNAVQKNRIELVLIDKIEYGLVCDRYGTLEGWER